MSEQSPVRHRCLQLKGFDARLQLGIAGQPHRLTLHLYDPMPGASIFDDTCHDYSIAFFVRDEVAELETSASPPSDLESTLL